MRFDAVSSKVVTVAMVLGLLAAPGCKTPVYGDLEALSFGDLSNPPAPRGNSVLPITEQCGESARPGPGAPTLVRLPHVQQLGDRSTRLAWISEGGAPGVTVTDSGGGVTTATSVLAERRLPLHSDMWQWTATINDLVPDTLYCYDLTGANGSWFRSGFRTAPAAGSGRTVRFVAFGDSGTGKSDQVAVYQQMRTVPFDFFVHTGDIAYDDGTAVELQNHYFDIYADVIRSFALFPVTGNHEYKTDDALPFRQAFVLPENGGPEGLERWYSFDWGDVHFVALDTERTGPVQAAWLEADLAANRSRWTIVYGHKPPFSSGERGSDGPFRQYFVPVIERHGVQLVLAGHDHSYERTVPLNGVTYVITGGGGKDTRSVGRSSFTAFSEQVLHFVYIEIGGDKLELHAIDGTGREFDSLVLRR